MNSFRGYKFSVDRSDLVLGFLVIEGNMEIRYAVYRNGDILQSSKRPYSHNFVQKGEKWTMVKAVPDHAEFIGNYSKVK